MIWNNFVWFAMAALLLWIAGAVFAWKGRRMPVYLFTMAGIAVFFSFILIAWITLERPPMRTMGETRLWYSFFMPVAGIIVYSRWRYKWILTFSTIMAAVFIMVNIFKPEIHTKELAPVLQSPWFAPHVIVYMFAYAMLGASAAMAVYLLFISKKEPTAKEMNITDNLVYAGTAFLTLGMMMGALWARQAWGDFWTWDPKETWAAATWLCYLVYIHLRKGKPSDCQMALTVALIAFICLQVCWWGINYLPSAAGSVHVY